MKYETEVKNGFSYLRIYLCKVKQEFSTFLLFTKRQFLLSLIIIKYI